MEETNSVAANDLEKIKNTPKSIDRDINRYLWILTDININISN